MELSRMLEGDGAVLTISGEMKTIEATGYQSIQNISPTDSNSSTPPTNLPPKHVIFEYLLTDTTQRARLPMRVNIYPHDGTESIITTVKNFFGLYDGNGVSFEDKDQNTLIARYENFADQMVVYVRVSDEVDPITQNASPRRPRLGPAFEMAAAGGDISRPSSRTAIKKRSASPQTMPGHRSHSTASTNKSRNVRKSRSVHGDAVDGDSESDGGYASVTSSRRGKIDVVASAEISVDNIVEGSRRHKRARFDSSELPLFVPSQVPLPGSVSSVSPQRRVGPNGASPYQYSNHGQFSYGFLASPQSFGMNDSNGYKNNFMNGFPARRQGYMNGRSSISGPAGQMMPTPDPTTVGSVISDEDVALQLMRLGDASNFSAHGRTSTSTVDDALSGRADASSSGETDYSSAEEEGEQYDGASEESSPEFMNRPKKSLDKSRKSLNNTNARVGNKHRKSSSSSSVILGTGGVNFQHFQHRTPLAEDEEDLSSKPRCQRCRKSKKGCDRQRPCGRCKDAGIGADGCVSEEETNGRKGRYGRHMGVPIKKDGKEKSPSHLVSPMMMKQEDEDARFENVEDIKQQYSYPMSNSMGVSTSMAPPPPMMGQTAGDKSRKRKR